MQQCTLALSLIKTKETGRICFSVILFALLNEQYSQPLTLESYCPEKTCLLYSLKIEFVSFIS